MMWYEITSCHIYDVILYLAALYCLLMGVTSTEDNLWAAGAVGVVRSHHLCCRCIRLLHALYLLPLWSVLLKWQRIKNESTMKHNWHPTAIKLGKDWHGCCSLLGPSKACSLFVFVAHMRLQKLWWHLIGCRIVIIELGPSGCFEGVAVGTTFQFNTAYITFTLKWHLSWCILVWGTLLKLVWEPLVQELSLKWI